VIAFDTNVLVYAHRREAQEHERAFELVRSYAEGSDVWAIPWPCVYEFFSVVTNPRIWNRSATPPEAAWLQLEAWFDAPGLRMLGEAAGFREVLGEFACRARVRGPAIHDARVAALCVFHGVETLFTRDRDFALFPELARRDPFL
jgi:uncharacterized protein